MSVEAVWLTVKLAMVTSVILLVISTPLAWWLSRWHHPMKTVLTALIALPLVLPPTVLGFYLLIAFSPQHFIGSSWLAVTGTSLAFSFSGIVIGSIIYSLPFAVQPLLSAFEQFDYRYLEVAKTLGMQRLEQYRKVVFPMCKHALVTAFGLSFAHTLGEFGVVLMIGGNIPDETRVASIALFDHVEALDYQNAHQLALVMLLLSFALLIGLYRLNRRRESL